MGLRVCLSILLCLVAGLGHGACIGFEGFRNGAQVTKMTVDGVGVTVSATGGIGEAWIFDSSKLQGGDPDLKGPFRNAYRPWRKHDPGNLLIIQENKHGAPDDNARGGTITFQFDRAVNVLGFKLFDDATVRVSSTSTRGRFKAAQPWAERRYANYNFGLTFAHVTNVSFRFDGSGAMDDLRFEAAAPVEAIPLPPGLALLAGGVATMGAVRTWQRRQANAAQTVAA
ncbi:MAG: hypothetical protein AAGF71_11460 [Pseudomonadota bacterium]